MSVQPTVERRELDAMARDRMSEDRLPNGKFARGNRANPGGRPKKVKEVEEMFQANIDNLFEVTMEIINDRNYPANARMKAVELGWAYAVGRPAEGEKLQNAIPGDMHFTFNMADTGRDNIVDGEVEEGELDERPALPPGES